MKKYLKFLMIIMLMFYATDLSALDTNLWSLPVPNSTEVVYKDMPVKVNQIDAQATHLRAKLGRDEILNFYQESLAKQGFVMQELFKDQGIVVFVKEERFLYVAIQDNQGIVPSDIYLVSSPSSLALCKVLNEYFLKEPIAQDAAGKDSVDIPRYPGSKRRLNIFAHEEGTILLYEVEAKPKDIALFYAQQLKQAGWQKIFFPVLVAQAEVLVFEKGENNIVITVCPFSKDDRANKKRSLITITKNMQEIIGGKGEEE